MLLDKIKYLCKINNMTIRDLEIKLSIGNGVIAKWEKGSPKADNLVKVADYFNLPLDYFFDREGGSLPVSQDIITLAEQIQNLPPELKVLVEQQIKVYAEIDK